VQTFAFPEEPVSKVSYYPIITAAPQYVREDAMGFVADKKESDEKAEHHQS